MPDFWVPWFAADWASVVLCLLAALPLAAGLPLWAARLLQALGVDEGDAAGIGGLWPAAHRVRARMLWWGGCLLLALVCGLRFGTPLAALAALVLTLTLWMLAWVDARTGLLPDGLTLPLLWLGLLVNLDGLFAPLNDAVLGAALGYGALWILAHGYAWLRGRQGMGGGDFKLLGALGAWLGWQALPMVLLMASVGGLVWALGLAVRGRLAAGQALVFGPWLALAGAWALLG